MEQAGHKCLGYVEWNEFARKSYEAIHNTKGEWTWNDITLQQLTIETFLNPIAGPSGSHVKISQLEEKHRDLMGRDPLYSLQLLSYYAKRKNGVPKACLKNYSLKTLKIFSQLTEDGTFSKPKLNWAKSGMTVNGNYSILENSEFPKAEIVYTLSDILEEKVDEKYFLSEELLQQLRYQEQKDLK